MTDAEVLDRAFLAAGGETGAMIRAFDWATTPLGSPERWPQPLKTIVGVVLGSSQPMFVAWGLERTLIYNDAYADILAGKHPQALGADFLAVWHEIRGDLLPIVEQAYAGEPVHMEDIELAMQRRGYVEETHFSFFYAPVRDEAGRVAGLYCACTEITGQVEGERRRREAEAALRAERDRTRRVLDGMAEGYGLLDRDFRLLDINAEGLRLEGRSREEIVGKTHWESWPGSEDSELGRLYKRAMAERTPASLDHRFVWGDGHEAWLETRVYPVDDGLALFWRDVTERRAAEQRVRESDARFRLTADAVPQIIWITDADGRTEFFNKQWSNYTGGRYEPSTAGDVAASYIHPDDAAPTLAAFDAARRTGDAFQIEHRIRAKTGEYRWFLVRAEPYRDPDSGAILRWFGASIDIHDRRQAEAALRESEERLRLVQAAGGIGSFDYDLQNDDAVCSPEYYAILGLPLGTPINQESWTAAIHPDDREKAAAALTGAIAARAPFDFEYRIVRPANGEVRWLSGRAAIVFDAEDRPWRYIGGNIDVTDRRRAEERLRELNETLEDLVAARSAERDRLWNLSQDMLARADYSGMMSAVSPAWTQVLGWSETELLSRGYGTFMHAEDMPPTLEAIAKMAETRQPTRFENRIATADGGWKPIEWTVAPEPDGVNFIAVGRDLSHAKAREAELASAQEALRQSQKMEAMGQLTGGVAHDFNNLLTPIIGSLDLLQRKGVGSERERRLIDGALQSAERAKTLVQRLLAFARRQPLQAVGVDLSRLVDGMVGLISSTLGPTIDVRVDLAEALPPAQADPNQLEMALLNLAVNARDAMPDGGELTITARRESVRGAHRSGLRQGHYVRIAVADTGVGMDEATRQRAVEPFFSTKGVGKGTGLGLSMVHGLAAQLGGALTLSSTPGAGTTVELWLPISSSVLDDDVATVVAPVRAGRGGALLVDDEELVRMTTADMLSDLGFDVVEASSAEEALHLLQNGAEPNILVTDHLMPGMSGAELARRARDLRPGMPVLIVSGYAEADGIAPDLPRLTKPFRNADLAASLAALAPGPD